MHYHARIDTDSGYVDRMDITVHKFVRNRIALFFYPYLKYIEIYFILKLNNVLMSEY